MKWEIVFTLLGDGVGGSGAIFGLVPTVTQSHEAMVSTVLLVYATLFKTCVKVYTHIQYFTRNSSFLCLAGTLEPEM